MDTAKRTPTLQVTDVSIGYQSKGEVTKVVAQDLNLVMDRGELVCLLGPNGAGKSTLIRALSGMTPPLKGKISINGKDYSELSPKERARQVSIVLTDSMSVGLMSVYSLVALGRHPHTNWTGTLNTKDHRRIDWALEAVNCKTLADRHIAELSDGERQKALIARALAQEAPIMFLDEPTAYLDLPRRVELIRILRDLAHNENLSILLSTHDLDLALRSADKLWLYNNDQTITVGPPEELALNGSIAQSFASDKLDWDTEQGSFRMHRNPSMWVTLSGDGAKLIWTQRLLARLGYGITEDRSKSEFAVNVSGENWSIIHTRRNENFGGLRDFISRLRGYIDQR
ncbi:ABC transporter ATP-binding protein [Puniceicoccaceae bacterium K14]|nr:ABC transporter ATP-binding protein [Puniceicoccaceae bacterium K14]